MRLEELRVIIPNDNNVNELEEIQEANNFVQLLQNVFVRDPGPGHYIINLINFFMKSIIFAFKCK